MHTEAFFFVRAMVFGITVVGTNVVEIGSYDVNGSVRSLFEEAVRYVGVDIRPGPGVDVVADAATYDGQGQFDIFVSTEVMEHMPQPVDLIRCAHRALRPGGLFILTAAAPPRAPHGRNGGKVGDEYYANIDPVELVHMLEGWNDVHITHNEVRGDVYTTARRASY